MPFVQYHSGERPVKRWRSWYDPRLVTQAGEDILSAIDTWAVAELRKHKMVWSGWTNPWEFQQLHKTTPETGWGFRKIEGIDPKRLRLFFLSLLWRAAATDLPEFSEVELQPTDLEELRRMICASTVEPLSFYPASLTQLSTLGVVHNQTPIAEVKHIPSLNSETPDVDLPIFRFYFDGLIAHIHSQSSDDGHTASLGNLIVGAGETLLLSTQTFESSYQEMNLEFVISESKPY